MPVCARAVEGSSSCCQKPKRNQGAGPGQQGEPAPVAEAGQRQHSHVQHQHVGQQQALVGQAFLQQQGRGEPSDDGEHGDGHRLMPQRQQRAYQRYQGEGPEGGRGGNEVVEGKSAVDRQVQDSKAAAGDRLGPYGVAPAPVFPRAQQRQPASNAQHHPLDLAQPAPVYGEADEEGDAEYQRHHTDAGQPVAAQRPFPVPARQVHGGQAGDANAASSCLRRGGRRLAASPFAGRLSGGSSRCAGRRGNGGNGRCGRRGNGGGFRRSPGRPWRSCAGSVAPAFQYRQPQRHLGQLHGHAIHRNAKFPQFRIGIAGRCGRRVVIPGGGRRFRRHFRGEYRGAAPGTELVAGFQFPGHSSGSSWQRTYPSLPPL